MKNRVAILLAVYNGEEFLSDQLNSILSQKNIEFKLFCSVDISSDESINIIRKYKTLYPDLIEILPYDVSSGSSAKNFIRLIRYVDVSKFDFFSFADQDDIWLSNKLALAVDALNFSGNDGYSSNVTAFWSDGRTKKVKKNYRQVEYDFLFEAPGPGCTFVLTRNLFSYLQSYLESNPICIEKMWMHDWFCYSFARFNGFSWYIDSKYTMFYRQHDKNVVGANFGLSGLMHRAKILLFGDGIRKVIEQAELLKQTDLSPIKRLISSSRMDFFILALTSKSFRRKYLDKFYIFIVFFSHAILGSNLDKK